MEILEKIPKPSFTKVVLKITYLRFITNFQEASDSKVALSYAHYLKIFMY